MKGPINVIKLRLSTDTYVALISFEWVKHNKKPSFSLSGGKKGATSSLNVGTWWLQMQSTYQKRQGACRKSQGKLQMLGGLHWWIASIFRGQFPQNEMQHKHDWASVVATLHTKKDCRSFIHLLSKRLAVSEARQMINISKPLFHLGGTD